MSDHIDDVFGPDGLFSQRFPGYEPRPQQVELSRAIDRGMVEGKHVLGEGPCGSGKCLEVGTKVLRFDGRIVSVETVVVGDELMGPDSQPRHVLATNSGVGTMFRIVPISGESWGCNDAHILTLSRRSVIGSKARQRGKVRDPGKDTIVDMDVVTYARSSATEKDRLKLFQPERIDFVPCSLPLPVSPYFLGVWLGDGSKSVDVHREGGGLNCIQVTKPDVEIEQCCRDEAERFGLTVVIGKSGGDCPTYRIARHGGQSHGAGESKYKRNNPLLDAMRGLMACGIRVPAAYKYGSRSVRAEVLAGLLDTDGHLAHGCYEIAQRRVDIADDVEFLARSLGLRVARCVKFVDGKAYQRLLLSGDAMHLPLRIPRKIAKPRRQIKNALRTGFTVEPYGVGPYYGFTLDGDGRFLLGDFTVTHNSIAYLVPATYRAVKEQTTVVVATANIALQEQLIGKDLPLLAEILPWKFRYALLKGRNNFACMAEIAKSDEAKRFDVRGQNEVDRQTLALVDWLKTTRTGDRSELPFEPHPAAWAKVAIGADDCAGKDCWQQSNCFSEDARGKAFDAHVVVTNYHMLFLHMKLKKEIGIDLVLPPFTYLICDESHFAADVARGVFGSEVSEKAVVALVYLASEFFGNHGDLTFGYRFDQSWEERTISQAAAFFEVVRRHAKSTAYDKRLRLPGFKPFLKSNTLVDELRGIRRTASMAARDLKIDLEDGAGRHPDEIDDLKRSLAEAKLVQKRAERIVDALESAVDLDDPGEVRYVELRGGKDDEAARIVAKTLDVGPILAEEMFGSVRSVACVSATMTVGGKFDFLRKEIGAPADSIEIAVGSPFDFETQAIIVVPSEVPASPKEDGFFDAAIRRTIEVVEACGGATLVLCTSLKDMEAVGKFLSARFKGRYRVLVQKDLPRTELVRLFKEDVSSILVGVDSFWTGVDVVGQALTGLVVWKLPFPTPEDPILDALCERDSRGKGDKQPFFLHSVPRAVMMVRQGVGRLIRSRTDRGVVAVMDRRMLEGSYSDTFVSSLPAFGDLHRDAEGILEFLAPF